MADKYSVVASVPALKPEEFRQIRELVGKQFGLELKPGKEELVLARLGRKLREGGFESFEQYFRHVVADESGESLVALIDALTTNYTSFFREPDHFDFLRAKIVPALRKRDQIRVWCAAAATGEEPYSLVITLLEALGVGAAPRIELLATDISTRALETARRGIYPEERFATLPQAVRRRYLLRGQGSAAGFYKVRPEVRKCVEFRRLNLIERIRHRAPFPVIFCRNVMIYFNPDTRRQVVEGLLEWLDPDGYLFVGHAESLGGREYPLRYIQPAIYQASGPARWQRRGGR